MNPFLIISSDLIDQRMAGQGIRCLELARELGRHVPVQLAVPERCDVPAPAGVEIILYHYGDPTVLTYAAKRASAVFAEPFILQAHPDILESDLPIVVDLYNPFVLEHLAVHQALPLEAQLTRFYENVELCNLMATRGDFFTCATERQRDWWLGVLQANGRVNPVTSAADPHLRGLIDVVAYGVTENSSTPSQTAKDAKVILWGGGLWNWLDPLTLIRAMPAILAQEPTAQLWFPGTRHPNTMIVPDMEMRQQAQAVAAELGLDAHQVVFGDWVPYEQWGSLLARADVAVSFHHESPETRFAALRSRVYGYIGARLPMVVQQGDRASEIVAQYQLGEVVPPNNPDAAATAILQVLGAGKEGYATHFDTLLESLTWAQTAAPLAAFARAPHRAADVNVIRGASPLQQAETERKIEKLQALVTGYQNGRLMRALHALQRLRTLEPPAKSFELPTEAVAPEQGAFSTVRRWARLATALEFDEVRRATERQLRRFRRRRSGATPTRLHRLYNYQLTDLGSLNPILKGIYTPGYGSKTVGNYLQSQFTENAEIYATKYTNYQYITDRLAPILEGIGFRDSSATTILDIGSGAGNSIFPLLELCPSAYIIASDLSVELLKLLQMALGKTENAKRVELLQLNAEELDFAGGSLDLVVGVAVLHHLFEPERTIAGCGKVLKPNGHAIFLEPFAEGYLTIARLYQEILNHPRQGALPVTVRRLLEALIRDFTVRAYPDKSLPIFNQLDDKQLFTVDFFERYAQRYGFRSCTVTPLHGKARQYESQTETFLNLTGVAPAATLPDWAWDIIRAEDATLQAAVPIEACVVLTK